MDIVLRTARSEDKTSIAGFTQGTFAWDDYVTDQFDGWLADPNGIVVVAVDHSDTAVAISRTSLASPSEAWLQGARVREDWRRRGIAGAMAARGGAWAKDRGALVSRLAVEEGNAPAKLQVLANGFRPICDWAWATRPVGEASPLPTGNGGRPVAAQEQLVQAHAGEVIPAYMSWTAGPMARPTRGLFGIHWTWRRLTQDDLERAARFQALWMARSGWVMAAGGEEQLEVAWLETREEDAVDLMRSIVDLATKLGSESVGMVLPAAPWLTTAARRAGCLLYPMTVYETVL